ncbi:hypothetical protein SLEP1_g20235 [Rubroshorea leprosula]|uniref:Uncharacterized protein n=1 Tax=Rubroshorea leprosula TaxID=152421 RepID=A0AAV5J7F5_9ROSI|nr:hypothetical protein SLEP1_g20235 [Rubroshorea leprosula]
MTTLQRSSVSFRRQGSSGRVWDDHLPHDPNSGPLFGKSPDPPHPRPDVLLLAPDEQNSPPQHIHVPERTLSSPCSESPAKTTPRCGFSALFRRCMGSSATQ